MTPKRQQQQSSSFKPQQQPTCSTLRTYYTTRFNSTLHDSYTRNRIVSLLLLLIQFYWHACLITPTKQQQQNTTDSINHSISRKSFSLLKPECIDPLTPVLVLLTLNTYLFACIVVDILVFNNNKTSLLHSNQKFMLPVRYSVSLLVSIYPFIVFIPAMYYSLNYMQESSESLVIGLIALTTTLFLQVIAMVHDKDFSFIRCDFLDRRNPVKWDICEILFDGFSAFLLSNFPQRERELLLMGFVRSVFAALNLRVNHPYSKSATVRLCALCFHVFLWIFVSEELIASEVLINWMSEPICAYEDLVISLILIPVSLKISINLSVQNAQIDFQSDFQLFRFYPKNHIKLPPSSRQPEYNLKLDSFLRSIIRTSNTLSISLASRHSTSNTKISRLTERIERPAEEISSIDEELLQNVIVAWHKDTCEFAPDCYCAKDTKFEQNDLLSGLKSQELHKEFAIDFIADFLRNFSSGKRTFEFLMTWIHFLVEKKSNAFILAFTELISLLEIQPNNRNNNLRIGLFEEYFIHRIFNQLKHNFSMQHQIHEQIESRISSGSNEEENSPHSRTNTTSSLIINNYMSGIEFDESVNELNTEFNLGMKQKLEFLTTISSDFIDLQILEEQANIYLKTRNRIEKELKRLNQMNRNSSRISRIVYNYVSLMSFMQSKKEFQGFSQLQSEGITMLSAVSDALTCIIFVSLIGRHLGIVQRTQNRIQSLFGWKTSEIIGSNINLLMPSSIGGNHDSILRAYISENKRAATINDALLPHVPRENHNRLDFILAKHKSGFGIPISIRLRSTCDGLDCGVCAEIRVIPSDMNYILTKAGSLFTIQLMTYKLFARVFSKYKNTIQETQQLHLGQVIPALESFMQQMNKQKQQQSTRKQEENRFIFQNEFYSTIAILPTARKGKTTQQNQNKSKLITTPSKLLEKCKSLSTASRRSIGGMGSPLFLNRVTESITNSERFSYDVFRVKIRAIPHKNESFEYHVFEFGSFVRIKDSNEASKELEAIFKGESNVGLFQNHIHTRNYSEMESPNHLEMQKSSRLTMDTVLSGGILSNRMSVSSTRYVQNDSEESLNRESKHFNKSPSNFLFPNSPSKKVSQIIETSEYSSGESSNRQQGSEDSSDLGSSQYENSRSDSEESDSENGNHKSNGEESDDNNNNNIQRNRQHHLQHRSHRLTQRKSIRRTASSAGTANTKKFATYKRAKEAFIRPNTTRFSSILSMLGFLLLVSIPLITFLQSLSTLSKLDILKQCGTYLTWSMRLRVEVSSAIRIDGLLRISDSGYFPKVSDISFKEIQMSNARKSARSVLGLYQSYLSADRELLTFFGLDEASGTNNVVQFDMFKDELVMQDRVTKRSDTKYSSRFHWTYAIQYYAAMLEQLTRKKADEQIYLGLVTDNFLVLNPELVRCTDNVYNLAVAILDEIVAGIMRMLGFVSAISFVLISSIFVLYFFAQKQKEVMLKTFATISTSQLKSMIQPVLLYQNSTKLVKIMSLFPEHVIKKRKPITDTSRLVKFQSMFIVYSSICFLMLIIQPITNLVFTQVFQTQTLASLDLLKNIYAIKAVFQSNLGLNYEFLSKVLMPSSLFYNEQYIYSRLAIISKLNKVQVDEMSAFVNTAYSSSKYKHDIFERFLFKIFEGNICEALQEFPEYMDSDSFISHSDCESLQKGILKSGFQINVQSFLGKFEELEEAFSISSESEKDRRIALIRDWEKSIDLVEFESYSNVLYKLIDIMKAFMLTILNDQLNIMLLVKFILDGFQVLFLALVFVKGWLKFNSLIRVSRQQSRMPFTILPLDVLFDNPYIQSLAEK